MELSLNPLEVAGYRPLELDTTSWLQDPGDSSDPIYSFNECRREPAKYEGAGVDATHVGRATFGRGARSPCDEAGESSSHDGGSVAVEDEDVTLRERCWKRVGQFISPLPNMALFVVGKLIDACYTDEERLQAILVH